MKFFDQKVKINGPKKSKFDLSHERKFSFNMGELIPILVQDVMPGDSFRVHTENLMRLAPMIAPMMHRVNVYTHYFFVPNRLIWSEWEQFITGGTPGSLQPVHPFFRIGAVANPPENTYGTGSLLDYMGLPPFDDTAAAAPAPIKASVLPFRAYQMIWNEYFRDQDLQTPYPEYMYSGETTGVDLQVLLTMKKRPWEKDYYTSARPWAQKGNSVGIPFTYKDISEVKLADGSPATAARLLGQGASPGLLNVDKTDAATAGLGGRIENIETLATINEFREANALQRFLEKLSRAGNRYIEYIKVIFGETSRDSRLQRPEYLGGGRNPIVISEVLSTYDNTTGGLPQGNMSGHGIATGTTDGFTRSFTEHGYIIGIMSVLPRTGYQQGVEKHWTRFDQFDYPIPDFAHLGEQPVLGKEIYAGYEEASSTQRESTFGYQSRYAECKFKNSTSHGDFRNTLAFYHMDRIFSTRPTLNGTFIESDPTQRIFAVTDPDQDHLWCQVYNNISAVRPLPYHGTPTL